VEENSSGISRPGGGEISATLGKLHSRRPDTWARVYIGCNQVCSGLVVLGVSISLDRRRMGGGRGT
jgi:hypothetical protein